MPRDAPVTSVTLPSSSGTLYRLLELREALGRRHGDGLRAAVDAADQPAQDGPGPDLDEARDAPAHEVLDRLREAHGCRELPDEQRHDRARLLEARRDGGQERRRGLAERDRL